MIMCMWSVAAENNLKQYMYNSPAVHSAVVWIKSGGWGSEVPDIETDYENLQMG